MPAWRPIRLPRFTERQGRINAPTKALPEFWIFGIAVAVFLFIHGYYVTTAFFGVIWRSTKPWVYPTISLSLFVVHTDIVFMRMGPGFTPEGRAMELPFAVGGAGIVFLCAFAGSRILNTWTNAPAEPNAYLNALGVIILVFMLANTAHYLRPIVGDRAFRTYGLPFTFYREGGFVSQWVWKPGELVWSGIAADIAAAATAVLLLGKAWLAAHSEP